MVAAALGTEIKIDTVEGVKTLKIPSGTQSGSDFKLTGLGVPHVRGKGRGDQIVRIKVETPKKLTKRQKELLKEFASTDKSSFWKR